MTVNDLASELATEAGEDFDDVDVAALFRSWVTEGYELITSAARFLWQNRLHTVNTVAATAEYTLNATVAEIITMQVGGSNTRITYTPVERLVALDYDLTASGVPSSWYYSGMNTTSTALKIKFYPVPDNAYAVNVYTLDRPSSLGSTDVIPLPSDFILVLRHFVRAMVLYNTDQMELYSTAIGRFDALLQLNAARYNQPHRTESRLKVKMLPRVGQSPAASAG